MAKGSMYRVVNTKIASMSSRLLRDEDYKKMIALKSPSVIALYLKENTAYGDFFKDQDPNLMHRNEIERLLKEGLINLMDKLIHYFNGDYRNFFKCFYLKYEIYDLKRIARLVHIDKNFEHLRENLVFAGKYRYIDMDMLLKAQSIEEIIESLEGTVYHPFLKNLVNGSTTETLYRFEMALDKAYFSILEENVKKISEEDQRAFYDLYGSYIDMLNIQWIYRGKKYYKLTPEEIFNYSINRGNRFNYKKIKTFCYAKDTNELSKMIENTPYGFMLKGDSLQDIFMERRMNRFMYFRLKSAKKRFKMDISILLSFMELIEFEIRDIISIVENVRYGMEYEEAKKYLIKAI
ncbi:V/A-type H+-transporting ATPase subunit C [Fonticella tunisiensis]|uniref:V/A-type H+-transporting ATPase subunit C n=2 Tax=Fonticella tunisiensis TaxID=1096341 RepID=A0A4R7KB76_9CLOT|nr:V/A-type H+-transporting ATPase subunit C [Fonticella tunisiensis]